MAGCAAGRNCSALQAGPHVLAHGRARLLRRSTPLGRLLPAQRGVGLGLERDERDQGVAEVAMPVRIQWACTRPYAFLYPYTSDSGSSYAAGVENGMNKVEMEL